MRTECLTYVNTYTHIWEISNVMTRECARFARSIIGSRGIAGVRTSDFVPALLLARSQVGRYCSIFRIKLSVMHVV